MRTRLSEVSVEAIGFDIAELITMADDGSEAEFEVSATPVKGKYERRPNTKTVQTRKLHEAMYQQSQTMRELEQLVLAFDALEAWADSLDDIQKYVVKSNTSYITKATLTLYHRNTNPNEVKKAKAKLEERLDYVTERIDPLCNEWLSQPKDGRFPQTLPPRNLINPYIETEEEQFRYIRTTYLPDIILGYHSALYTSGHLITRDILVQCLSLATVVSGSPTLTESFIASQRMCELVDVFALSSREIAGIRETKPSKKKLSQGASLDIWKVKLPVEGEEAATI